jgi:hypothetical protein
MSTVVARQSFYIDAPVETVFDYFKDPNKQRETVLFDMQDVKMTEEGVGTHYTWSFKVAGLRFGGFEVLTEVVPNTHITERSSMALTGLWEYDFRPEGAGTRVTLTLHPQSLWRFPPLEQLVSFAFPRVSRTVMPRFIKAIEAEAKKPQVVPEQRKPAAEKARKPVTST